MYQNLCTKISRINAHNKTDGYDMGGMKINEQMNTASD